ncbi:MAG TPA: hypothetical protein VMU59_03330 [Caulobacteraceae bacterium]|nr:hypothetical protein [Caulobacteraceae bacterium]
MAGRTNPWFGIGLNAWSLAFEASTVIGLRTMKIAAGGPAAGAEVSAMINEKLAAGLELQMLAITGGLGASPPTAAARTLVHYRRKVRANRRRLAKG